MGEDRIESFSQRYQRAKEEDRLIQFFGYNHLPTALHGVSQPFCHLAMNLVFTLPKNPERTLALRALLEAKDNAVRSVIAES